MKRGPYLGIAERSRIGGWCLICPHVFPRRMFWWNFPGEGYRS